MGTSFAEAFGRAGISDGEDFFYQSLYTSNDYFDVVPWGAWYAILKYRCTDIDPADYITFEFGVVFKREVLAKYLDSYIQRAVGGQGTTSDWSDFYRITASAKSTNFATDIIREWVRIKKVDRNIVKSWDTRFRIVNIELFEDMIKFARNRHNEISDRMVG